MLGVGMQEMMIIGLAALLLFGPGKLPEVMSQAGKWYKQFRDVTDELSGEFNKTVAEAKGELDAMGVDLGPMQQQVNSITRSVQKDLGGTAGKKTTTTGTRSTTSAGAKKSTSSSKSTSAKAGGKTTTNRNAVSATKTGSTGSKSMTAGKPVVVASKEDPIADVSMFEQAERKPKRRARSATPTAFTDLTPRDLGEPEVAATDPARAAAPTPITIDRDDPIARARERRMKAGYAQATA